MPYFPSALARVLLSLAGLYLLLQTACLSLPEQSCIDGIKNYNEEEVDCGGDCPYCSSCEDGIRNGLEIGIDCGGPRCIECHECNDGLKNGDETGIDCGGKKCTSCTCSNNLKDPGETLIDCGGTCIDCATPACTLLNSYISIIFSDGQAENAYINAAIGTIDPNFNSIGLLSYINGYPCNTTLSLNGKSPTTPSYAQYRFPIYADGTASIDPYIYGSMFINNLTYLSVPGSGYVKVQYANRNAIFSSCGIKFSRGIDTITLQFSQSF